MFRFLDSNQCKSQTNYTNIRQLKRSKNCVNIRKFQNMYTCISINCLDILTYNWTLQTRKIKHSNTCLQKYRIHKILIIFINSFLR